MAAEPNPITVRILDKDYLVGCPPGEREALVAAASFLDHRMREIRDASRVLGTERLAVITALNIAHELLQDRQQRAALTLSVDTGIRRITEKLEEALQDDNAL